MNRYWVVKSSRFESLKFVTQASRIITMTVNFG